MRIPLSPLAYCDFTIPDSVALDDPAAVQVFEMAQQPGVIAFHKLDETAQCELSRVAFDHLVKKSISGLSETEINKGGSELA